MVGIWLIPGSSSIGIGGHARVRAEGVEEGSRPTLLGADDEKIRQRPLSGVDLAEPQEGGFGEGGEASGGSEAEAVED